ncbi:MAG: carboxypeptidase M32 [Synechococcus sp. SB0676_bin_10]|uniref:Metal-dependent carboxypeptidase n=1 Tax=Synechococcus sp. SB0676_bin_10 TaxID=2604869 RepID=A0A6B1F8L0_9SYNE|nr:carboxypeptidase M32 [Synechococcus sp. SB0676_bin_10]
MSTAAFDQLRHHQRETHVLAGISSCLHWDQNTDMHPAGAAWRGEQLAWVAQQLHGRQTSSRYGELLADAEAGLHQLPPDDQGDWRRNLALLRQQYERQCRLDPALVNALAEAQARGYSLWQEARRNRDFPAFAPALATLIRLRLEQVRQLAEPRSPWETLAQPFEPDISHQRLGELFAPLRQRLPALVERVRSASRPAAPRWSLDEAVQQSLCGQLLESWGFDERRCVLASSPHPFSTNLGPEDFRITSRTLVHQPLSAFLATAHEWGHSLYDQGLPGQESPWFGFPLAAPTSMGVHESQSLFWENRVARGRAFSQVWAPRFGEAVGAAPWGDADGLWVAMNPLESGLIRVEAGELSYCLHVLLRYELETDLLERQLPVAELPERWCAHMARYLDTAPAHVGEGCLQDVHWSEGLFGYFPSYALGHLISAQLAEAMEAEIGPVEAHVAAGQERQLLHWLRRHVHPLGRRVNAEQLVQQVTGRPLSADPFLRYLDSKLDQLLAVQPKGDVLCVR